MSRRRLGSKHPALSVLGSVLGLAAPLLLLAQLLTSCGSDGSSKTCNAGDLHMCTCGASGMGTQTCKDDGSGYGTCSCDATGAGGGGGSSGGAGAGGGAMSQAGSTGMSTTAPFPRGVGSLCDTDADCAGAPLVCLTSTSTGALGPGGPAGGYCSLPCAGDADCTAVDDLSICLQTGYCSAVCLPGPLPASGSTQTKCRPLQACLSVDPTNNSLGACLPRCDSDADCGTGRFCNPGLRGLCQDTPPPGGQAGDPCTVATAATDCASGFCITYRNGAGTGCGGYCTLGLLDGCGYDSTVGGVRKAYCLAPAFSGGNVLDLGICIALCDTTADCAQAAAGWVCDLFTDPSEVSDLGRKGNCIPGSLATSAGADAGPVVDAGP